MPADAADSPSRSTAGEAAAQPALAMLAIFATVGVERFDLTLTNLAGGKVAFRGHRPLSELHTTLPPLLEAAVRQQHNVIVRPRRNGPALIQLDDLDDNAEARLRPMSFLTLRTSPGNYQAWVAVADADAGFARRLRKGAAADLSASGATRLSGSWNFKQKYAPSFPRVETVHARPGLVVTRADLEALGVVAPLENLAASPPPARASHRSGRRGWPNYQRCVKHAPPTKDGSRPDISRADFTFCLLALDWGWEIEETAARLMQESSKAQENGEAYARRTAGNAAAALARRHGQGR
jgi:RepB DNA-primase from phage plasmid